VAEYVKTILTELDHLGGQARLKELFPRADANLNLTDYEREPFAKSGFIRWQALVHFNSIPLVKAGYIQKSGGKWHLTDLGKAALAKPAMELLDSAISSYKKWKTAQPSTEELVERDAPQPVLRQTAHDQAVEQARAEIEEFINNLGPYDFQKLVSELLLAMGYYVPFVAPPGRDGGIDVVAYKDPLGTSAPRLMVQVKHRDNKVSVKEVRELEGLLRRTGDIGLIVSSGGFSNEVEREIRASTKHIELMDLDRLIELWQQHYDKVREPGKALLPLVQLFVLAPTEE
jgi:restriction system protein